MSAAKKPVSGQLDRARARRQAAWQKMHCGIKAGWPLARAMSEWAEGVEAKMIAVALLSNASATEKAIDEYFNAGDEIERLESKRAKRTVRA